MSLYSQSIINNFFNDKVSVIGALIGIAGCTALVVTAMTLYIDVNKTFDTQYDKVYNFDSRVVLSSASDDAASAIIDEVDASSAKGAEVARKLFMLTDPTGDSAVMNIEVPEDPESFMELFHLNNVDGSGQAQLSDDGVWLSEAYAEHFGEKVGDTVGVTDATGNARHLRIDGFFEYHLNHHEMVMTRAYYEKEFGEDAQANNVLIDLNGTDETQLVDALQKVDGYFSYSNEKIADRQQFDTYQSLTSTMIVIYLVLSILMAMMVLLNLTVMFIEEKKRDLIVLMINGFSIRDAKRYIYRDNIVLTVIGTLIGVLIGMLLGYWTVLSIEFSVDAYVNTPSLVACLSGVLMSFFFAFLVNLIALRRIPRFNLTDINKV